MNLEIIRRDIAGPSEIVDVEKAKKEMGVLNLYGWNLRKCSLPLQPTPVIF